MGNVLLRVSGSIWLSNSWKQELVITDEGVEGEVVRDLKRIRMHLPYDRIAQVNVVRGIFSADLEVINKGGASNLVVKALSKDDAEQAKALIEERLNRSSGHFAALGGSSVADEIRKLADLKAQGLLTESEFQAQKAKLLR